MESDVIWVGIDVGRYHHAFCGIDSAGGVVWERKKVLNTTLTMRRALDQLLRFARGRPLRLATEEPGGNASALLRLLTAAGQQVYLAQPLRVHRFHLALGQPHKSDPYDAQVIAQFARQNAGRLPRVRIGTPDLQALKALSRRLEAIGKDLRRCLNRLRGVLAEYAPEWLACGVFQCWAKEAALNTLQRYGRISKLRRTPVSRLSRAIQQWTRGQMGDAQARALLEAFADVSVPDEVEEAYFQVISSMIRQIRGLLAEKERLVELIAACGSCCPALGALQAECGYGLETAATIVSEVGDAADFPRESAFATYCGVTPLKRKSGISAGSARLSRFTNRRLLRALIQTSYTAAHYHPESKAYYQSKLAGRSDPRAKTSALIALARHRARRLYKILQSASQSQDQLEVAA
jgi:transposase